VELAGGDRANVLQDGGGSGAIVGGVDADLAAVVGAPASWLARLGLARGGRTLTAR